MHGIIYLLLIAFGALLMLGIFQFTIYLQQKDKAYLHYSLYLFVMAAFFAARVLDARLTDVYPISLQMVDALDVFLSNLGFLMYVNFLGVVLNISKGDRLFFTSWRFIVVFVLSVLTMYAVLKIGGIYENVAGVMMGACSFISLSYGLFLLIRLIRYIRETFYLLIITGTTILASSIIAGLVVNYFIEGDRLSFPGLGIMGIGMLAETVFLSAAMGYRLKLAYREKMKYQQSLLEETKRHEELATQTAGLLRKELDLRNWQNKISRDLHDDIGASLSSIHVYSSVAVKAMDTDKEKAKETLNHVISSTRRVMENMSDIVWAINAPHIETAGLENKLKNYGFELLNPLGITCNYQIENKAEQQLRHPDARKTVLLIAKEAMNNIAKYSGAGSAFIRFELIDNHLELEISDDGKGFDTGNCPKGNGLVNMKERCIALGGTIQVLSELSAGTRVLCKIPISNCIEK